jgi:hypothetical protein
MKIIRGGGGGVSTDMGVGQITNNESEIMNDGYLQIGTYPADRRPAM